MNSSQLLPPNIVRRMSPEDRKREGLLTPEERRDKSDTRLEAERQRDFIQWCNQAGVVANYNRTDRKSTAVAGTPDVICTRNNQCAYVEFKANGRQLAEEQIERIRKIRECGCGVLVTESVGEAIEFTIKMLGVRKDL